MSTVKSYTPQSPNAEEKRFFSDRLPPSLIKVYAGICNSPTKLGLIIIGLILLSISFLGSIEFNSLTSPFPLFAAGLAAFGISMIVHKELATRSRDFFLLTPLSGRSIVWGHWLAVILPLFSIGAIVLLIDIVSVLFAVSLPESMAARDVRNLITLDDALTTNLNSAYLLSFICLTSFLVSIAHMIASGSKLNSFVSLGFVIGIFCFTVNSSESSHLRYFFDETFLFTQHEAWLGYALGNTLLLGSSVLMLTMAQRHYKPSATWRPWGMRLLSLIPLALTTSIELMNGLTPILLQPLWELSIWITLIIAIADCLYFAPRAGVREIISSRLWLGAIFLAASLLPREIFPADPGAYEAAVDSFMFGFTTLIFVPLLIISIIFGANSIKAGNYLFIGMLVLTTVMGLLEDLFIDERSTLTYALIVLLLYIASSAWNGFRISFNKNSSDTTTARAGMSPLAKLSDILPADLVKSLRQYFKSPINIIFIALIPLILFVFPTSEREREILASVLWIVACIGISFIISTHNKKELSEKGNNFFIFTPQSPQRIVLNQWISGMVMVLLVSACIFPFWLSNKENLIAYVAYLLSVAAFMLSLMLLLQGWGVIFRLGIMGFIASTLFGVSLSSSTAPLSAIILVLLVAVCLLLMARRFYESSDRHNMLPVRLICIAIMILPALFWKDKPTVDFTHQLGFDFFISLCYSSAIGILLLDCLVKRDPRHYKWSGIHQFTQGQGTFSNLLTMILLLIVAGASVAIHEGIVTGYACAIMLSYKLIIFTAASLLMVELATTPYSGRRALSFILGGIALSVIISFITLINFKLGIGLNLSPMQAVTEYRTALDPIMYDDISNPFKVYPFLILGSVFLLPLLFLSFRNHRYYRINKAANSTEA